MASSDTGYQQHHARRLAYWDDQAIVSEGRPGWGQFYHRRLTEIYRFLVPEGQRVIEIGCGYGDLLAALSPRIGVGVDFSPEMIARARRKHPQLRFVQADAHQFTLDEKFDYIILSDLVNDLWDVQAVFGVCARLSHRRTRIILNTYSRLWELPLAGAAWLKMARPTLYQNWLTPPDLENLFALQNFQTMRCWQEVLLWLPVPFLDGFFNRMLVKIWPFSQAALTNFMMARPLPAENTPAADPLVSVIVPARNEAGNVAAIFERVPEMGRGVELVFVEGHSSDDTYQQIQEQIAAHPHRRCQLLKQAGNGKGDAVRQGIAAAAGEIIMILDADLTVPPEDLPRFFDVLVSGKADFVNGVRLVYPMEGEAMRFINLVGNKFFSLAFSWLLGTPIKDTLCGTKVFWKTDYEAIAVQRAYFGDFDPFGDFDLLFGASKLNLKIMDLPIRYRRRVYGSTNIHRWKHGWLLLRMVFFAARRLKFV